MSSAQAIPAEATPALREQDEVLAASLAYAAHVRADAAQIEALRRDPGPLAGRDLPASFLRHSEEQSVCGFAAMLQAIHKSGQGVEPFAGWGVVGAPRYPGRAIGGSAMAKFFDQGVRGISPHAIPQISLHSLAGVVSVGLGLYGPNLGAGGGPGALADGFMSAFSMLSERRLPGVWLVVTAWDREPLPQKNGRVTMEGACHAVAMALSLAGSAPAGLRLTLDPVAADRPCGKRGAGCGDDQAASVMSLADALSRGQAASAGDVLWRLSLDWGAEITLARHHSS